MPRVRVNIRGTNLEEAEAALRAAGLGKTSISFPGRFPEPGSSSDGEPNELEVDLEAETTAEAEKRVRDTLPADGDYTVQAEYL